MLQCTKQCGAEYTGRALTIELIKAFNEDFDMGGDKQGGIFPGNQGARFPRNLQAHTKFLQQFTLFWREFDFKVYQYFLSNEGILPITHNMQEIFSCHRKKFLVSGRNFLALEEISCHRKKLFVKGRNFMPQL